jgi:hypothetical protein
LGPTGPAGATGSSASVTGGNGISVSAGSVAVACPTFNTVGSYASIILFSNNINPTGGSNYAAGGGSGQVLAASVNSIPPDGINYSNTLSGTWKWMGSNGTAAYPFAVACRVS